ncbi:MAG: glycosyltransferase [Ignavibacteriaceae bacterium]|jgi:glycosyltransferase involved in cell wall biosynthesis|nr:glycosyltransferase [Ignavibacteriaceae bacterium]
MLISVVLAVKNGMPYLPLSVNSILSQTEKRFELVIVENGSSDDTLVYLTSIVDSRVKICSIADRGLIYAYNYGFSLCSGDYIAIMDSDDYSHAERFQYQLELLRNNASIGLVGTSIFYFGNNPKRKWFVGMPQKHFEIIKALKVGKHVMVNSTVMFRRQILDSVGGYRESAYPVPDLDFYLRVGQVTRLANLRNVYCGFRIHENSFTSKNMYSILEKQNILISDGLDSKPIYKRNKMFYMLKSYIMKIKLISWKFYRKGLREYLNGSNVKWIVCLIVSGVLNPSKAYFFIKEKLVLNQND